QAIEMMFRLIEQMADKEGVTEQLKAGNSMLWVGRMNEI
ncbi:TnpV protein, partial [Streptococcus parasuis]